MAGRFCYLAGRTRGTVPAAAQAFDVCRAYSRMDEPGQTGVIRGVRARSGWTCVVSFLASHDDDPPIWIYIAICLAPLRSIAAKVGLGAIYST